MSNRRIEVATLEDRSRGVRSRAVEPVSWGILSTARINRSVLVAGRSSKLCRFVAVASRTKSRAEGYARAHQIERAHGSYEALLNDPTVEAIYISLPNALHSPWTIQALRAGKHVLCEKPLSRRVADVIEMYETAEREQRLLSEGFMYRHLPQSQKLRELVVAGAIGQLRLIRASFSFRLEDESDIRSSAECEGGALADLGCYCVNTARLLAGEPARVYAYQHVGRDGVDEAFIGSLEWKSGVGAQFDVSLALPTRSILEVVGTDGSLEVSDPWHGREAGFTLRHDYAVERVAVEAVNPYRLQLENFSRAVRGEEKLLLDREDAVGQARVLEALYRSATETTTVEISGIDEPSP